MTPQIKQRLDQIQRGEVPEGYKRTKAGVVPIEWEETRLARYLVVNSDKNISLQYGKDDVFSISGELGIVNQIELLGRSYAGVSVEPYGIVYPDNVVYTKSPLKANPYGIIKTNKTGKTGIVSTLYAIFRCNDNVCPDFVQSYFELDQNLNNYLYPIVNIGAKHDMKISDENSLKGWVVFPPLDEQKKIAEILSAQDKLIALKEKLIEEKKRQKKYLMQQLLTGKKRLPGFSGEWEKKKIKDNCIDVITGNTPSKKDEALWNGKFPWITSQDFCGKYINQSSETLSPMGKEQCRVVPAKSVLITCIASIGLNAITNIECATNQQINAIVCASEEMAEYVYYYMELHEETMKRLAGKTAVPIINKSQFENFPIIFPHDNAEMKKIVEYLSAYDKEIELLDMQLNQEKQKKKALMQLLLTGIVRV